MSIDPGMKIGVVVDNKDPELAGRVKVIVLGEEGPNVQAQHKAWSQNMVGGHAQGGQSTNHGPDIGTMVSLGDSKAVSGPAGSNFNYIASVIQNIPQFTGLPGGTNLVGQFTSLINQIQQVHIPPNVQETQKDGAVIRQKQEKGQNFSYGALSGIPTHASLPPIMGMHLPEVKNISTAIDNFSATLTSGMASAFPGSAMGSIFSLLDSKVLNEILSALSPELAAAFQSIQSFTRDVQTGANDGFSTGVQVDPTSFISNLKDKVTSANNISSLSTGLMDMYQPENHGLSNLGSGSINITTPFGNLSLSIGADGSISLNIPKIIQDIFQAFSGLLGSFDQLPGASGDRSIFGDMSKNLSAMHSRLPPEIQNARKQSIEALATLPQSLRINNFIKPFLKGGQVGQ